MPDYTKNSENLYKYYNNLENKTDIFKEWFSKLKGTYIESINQLKEETNFDEYRDKFKEELNESLEKQKL